MSETAVMDGEKRLTQITGRFLASTPKRSLDRQKLAKDSPLKRFPINRDNGSIEQIKSRELASRDDEGDGKAHGTYYPFMQSSQGGRATIASDNQRSLFAVKTMNRSSSIKDIDVKLFKHDQVVSLLDVYHVDGQTRLVYDLMFVSLRNITSTPRGRLRVFEIQAICKEIVDGLHFVHKELGLYHGRLDCDQILLDLEGRTKIANVGESMMRAQRTNEDTERVDLLGLRRIMLELMEPRTCRYGDGEEELRHPEEWEEDEGSGIIDFLRATTTCSLDKLQKHMFLPPNYSIRTYLKELVVVALFSASIVHQEVFPPDAIEAGGSELWC